MTLQEQDEKIGNWLFKRRSYFPIIFIVIGILWYIKKLHYHHLYWDCSPIHPWWVDFLFLCVGFFGLTIRILTVGFTPKGTSGRNTGEGQIAEQLNTTGIYSIVRNPLYLGNFFMWLAPMLIFSNLSFILWFCLFFYIFYRSIIFAEEQFLKRKFGQEYLDWANKTPVFFPKFSLYKKANLTFSLKNVLKREYNSFFSLVFTMTLIRTVGLSFVKKQPYLDMPWVIIISSAFVIFISLKMLKKFTKVLEVEGR
jgi:protein-S-isoprenylcysteine O-methyltransferase Ste14